MPKPTADEVVTRVKHKRNYIQFGGALPGNDLRYAGQNAQYMRISGVSVSEYGTIDPINVPDLPASTITFLEKHGSVPRQLQRMGCFNVYEYTGACKDLSDVIGGWDDYILVYSSGIL